MHALVVPETSGARSARLTEVDEPVGAHPWADGQRILVEVRAAGVSFPDLLQSRGAYQHGLPTPYVVGGEVAGVVLEAPPSAHVRPGDRVAGITIHGAVAQRALAIPRYTVRIPDTMSWAEGAAFVLNYSTAWMTLDRASFADGESVLVHGAAGGVGTATLDLLRGRAAPLVAVVSSEDKAALVAELGADVVLRTGGPWARKARAATGGFGVDLVVDPVGGDRFTDSLRCLDVGGRLMVVGFASGSIPEVKVNRLLLRDLTVMGVATEPWMQRYPETVGRLRSALEAIAEEGRVRPRVGAVLPLERAEEALVLLESRTVAGKVVVEVG